ncbi:MAG: GFA family protein [Pseudomonadota bacterium]
MTEGGCHCGEIRYRVTGRALNSLLCNCAACRGTSGAQNIAFFMVKNDAFRWVRGTPKYYASSPGVRRGFCADCGTTLSYQGDLIPGLIDITVGSLDDPDAFPAEAHVNDEQAVAWTRHVDDLPRFAVFPE